ncbi:MAG: thermonuclease family protein [Prevotella sp.]|jgi:endonuclease YncB( thermonuclease family)|nr:thermonuclease family protein [Prevotella sp.]
MKQAAFFVLIAILSFTSCERKSGRKNSVSAQQGQMYDYYVQAVGVVDGDTFDGLTQDKVEIRFRIYGIDAPEKEQAFNDKSKKYLSDLIYGKIVGIKVQKKRDGYGRPVVWVYTPDGKDTGAEMLRSGMAWHSKEYDISQEYADLEAIARRNSAGLWNDKNPIAPWYYRQSEKGK